VCNGTLIISLKPFVSEDFKLTSRTINYPEAILERSIKFQYSKNSVSWSGESGYYFLTKVNRENLIQWLKFNESKEY